MTDEERKIWLQRGAIAFAVLAALAAFYQPAGAWPLTALAVACLLAANIDKIGALKAGGAGSTPEWTQRAEAAVNEMSEIADRLGNLEAGTQNLLTELGTRTEDLVGQITGGESYPLVRAVPAEDGTLALVVECKGKHPLRGLSVQMVDASVADPRTAAVTSANVNFIAAHGFKRFNGPIFDRVRKSDEGRLDIFFDASNGVMYQFLDYRQVDGKWHFASCVLAHGRAFKHMDDPDFGPQPDWEAERVRFRIELEHEPSGKIM